MKRQFIFLGVSGFLGLMILGIWASVEAESQPVPPKFSIVKNLAGFNLVIDKKPISASDLKAIDQPPDSRQSIVGKDDRIAMTSRKNPWSSVGKIEMLDANGNGYSCTGTLISESEILTNAHCIVSPETHKAYHSIAFLPNLINGVLRDQNDIAYGTDVTIGTDFPTGTLKDFVDDWAVVKLNKPLGKKYGYLKLKSIPSFDLVGDTEQFALVGYSGDFPNPNKQGFEDLTAGQSMTAGVHLGCSILKQKDNLLYHNCDTTKGASGGAIIGQIGSDYYVFALHSGSDKVNGLLLNRAVDISRIR
ncbi:MAG: trypsin-like serine protease [Nostoc sp.]|uniref:trypsin-like serine peptidase n=1 Tax=Nostoc sp. TaxID=1180 RepID=UPI002FF625CA